MQDVGFLHVISIILIYISRVVDTQAAPTHCYFANGVYQCNYDKMASISHRPIPFADFSTQPQQLILNVNGILPYFGDSRIFNSGFSGIDDTLFDDNYPAWLDVNCGWAGSAYIETGAFTDMQYIQHLKITNCRIFYINTNTFDAFQELDYFGIEGGSIDTVEALAMNGLTVEQLSSANHQFPRLQGKFEVVNSKFLYGVVNIGLLTYFINVQSIIFKNTGITYLSPDLLKENKLVRIVDLSDNLFTKLPSGFFDYQTGISEVVIYGIGWDCTCELLWWVQYTFQQNITVRGDKMCNNIQGMSVLRYYHDNCASTNPCEGYTGIAIGDKCQSVLSIVLLCLSIIALTITSGTLVLVIVYRNNIHDIDDRDPVMQQRLKLKARQRWRKALRHIIYSRRKGNPLYDQETEGRTMSIPDETRSPFTSNDYSRYGNSSFGLSDIGNFTYNSSSVGQSSCTDFSSHEDLREYQRDFRYTEI